MERKLTFEEQSRLLQLSCALRAITEVLGQLGELTQDDRLNNTSATNLSELLNLIREEQDRVLNKDAA